MIPSNTLSWIQEVDSADLPDKVGYKINFIICSTFI